MDAVRLEVRERSDFLDALRRDPPHRFPATRSCSAAWPRACRSRFRTTSSAIACCRRTCLLVAVPTTEMPRMPRRSGSSYAARRRRHPRRTALRLHGGAQHSRGSRLRWRAARSKHRSRPGGLLHRARDDHPLRAPPRPAPLARGDLRLPAPQRPAARRLFQDPGAQIMEIGVEFEI